MLNQVRHFPLPVLAGFFLLLFGWLVSFVVVVVKTVFLALILTDEHHILIYGNDFCEL